MLGALLTTKKLINFACVQWVQSVSSTWTLYACSRAACEYAVFFYCASSIDMLKQKRMKDCDHRVQLGIDEWTESGKEEDMLWGVVCWVVKMLKAYWKLSSTKGGKKTFVVIAPQCFHAYGHVYIQTDRCTFIVGHWTDSSRPNAWTLRRQEWERQKRAA